jgi:hypothetical protein
MYFMGTQHLLVHSSPSSTLHVSPLDRGRFMSAKPVLHLAWVVSARLTSTCRWRLTDPCGLCFIGTQLTLAHSDFFFKAVHHACRRVLRVPCDRSLTRSVEGLKKSQRDGNGTVTDLVLGHPGIYSNLLELQQTIMYFITLWCHLTRSNAVLSS